MPNNISILSTGEIDTESIQLASKEGIALDCIPFIETKTIESPALRKTINDIAKNDVAIVFTSQNAVESVLKSLNSKPQSWNIYCIEGATKDRVTTTFGDKSIRGSAPDATSLGELIAATEEKKEIIFFCGDKRRDELPQKMKKSGIEYREIVVYETILMPKEIQKRYEGILFFSPSAVESFFQKNKPGAEVILFAIGNTTATAIRNCSSNQIIVPDLHSKDALIKKMIAIFSKTVNG